MALPHLTSSADSPKYKLNGIVYDGDGHLLIVRQTNSYQTKELVVTPSQEKFVAVAAWGDSSYYNQTQASLISQDANVLVANLNGMIGNLTANDWTVGHKSIFGYYARSGCPARAAYSPSTTTATMQQRYLEFAATRHLLKFDMKHIPFGMFSTANVYLRFRNPSWLQQVSIGGAGLGYNFAHNDTSDILYKFSDSPLLPKDLETGTYGYCRLCDGYFANKGQMSSGGTSCGYGHYDPWNLAGSTTVYSRTMTPYFYDQTEWDNDHQVSDADVLEQLKLAASSSRYVYMLIGPRIGNGISSSSTYGASVGSVMAAYTTRVELVLRLTGNAYNA